MSNVWFATTKGTGCFEGICRLRVCVIHSWSPVIVTCFSTVYFEFSAKNIDEKETDIKLIGSYALQGGVGMFV